MTPSLSQSLAAVFKQVPTQLNPSINSATVDSQAQQSALKIYQQAQQALQQGNWIEYGRYQQQLQDILQKSN